MNFFRQGNNALLFLLLITCIVFAFYISSSVRESSALNELIRQQRIYIESANDRLDSISGHAFVASEKSAEIVAGLDSLIEFAGRTDAVIAGLRAAMGEAGSGISVIVERQQRINGLAKKLIDENQELKRRLELVANANRRIEERNDEARE